MDKFTKIKCFGCGIFLAVVMGAESLSIICHECHHVSVPHLPEQNYTAEFNRMPIINVSGIFDTAIATNFQWFDTNTS